MAKNRKMIWIVIVIGIIFLVTGSWLQYDSSQYLEEYQMTYERFAMLYVGRTLLIGGIIGVVVALVQLIMDCKEDSKVEPPRPYG